MFGRLERTSQKWILSRFSPDDNRRESSDVDDATINESRMRRNHQNWRFCSTCLLAFDDDLHTASLIRVFAQHTQVRHDFSAGFFLPTLHFFFICLVFVLLYADELYIEDEIVILLCNRDVYTRRLVIYKSNSCHRLMYLI